MARMSREPKADLRSSSLSESPRRRWDALSLGLSARGLRREVALSLRWLAALLLLLGDAGRFAGSGLLDAALRRRGRMFSGHPGGSGVAPPSRGGGEAPMKSPYCCVGGKLAAAAGGSAGSCVCGTSAAAAVVASRRAMMAWVWSKTAPCAGTKLPLSNALGSARSWFWRPMRSLSCCWARSARRSSARSAASAVPATPARSVLSFSLASSSSASALATQSMASSCSSRSWKICCSSS
eukprot:10541047-Heterocapsa_arctica.AAC.1